LARLMGLPGKVGIDGSQVHQAYKDEKFEEIDSYCMQDVFQTAMIFQRFQYMTGKLTLEGYREAATATIDYIKGMGGHEEFLAKVDKAALLIE
jgi:predicted PolB exonuclease-like 3'-5' exonuclease